MRQSFESRLTRASLRFRTILVAGDPADDGRLILAAGLTYAGYGVRLADTGDDMLREASADGVSLVVAEVDLTCADGPCAIEVLKRTPALRHIPVLAYSAPDRSISEARALSAGADHFVGDPVHLRGVLDVVATMEHPAGLGTGGAASHGP